MIDRADAIRIIKESVLPLKRTEYVRTTESLNSVLAEDIAGEEYVPSSNISAMDGYAVNTADFETEPFRLKVAGLSRAGADEKAGGLEPGTCIQIMTGAIVPEGANAVVKVEDTTRDGDYVVFQAKPTDNQNIRFRGEDVWPGKKIIEKGSVINFGELASILLTGREMVKVLREPRIGIVSTGDELIDFREIPKLHQKREVNSLTVQSIIKQRFKNVRRYPVIKDDYKATIESLRNIIAENDVIIVSGGMSMGKFDFVRPAVKELGFDILLHGVNQKPGKPFTFGVRKGDDRQRRYFIGLPGSPVATISNTVLLVMPFLRYLVTGYWPEFNTISAINAQTFEKDDLRMEFARAVYNEGTKSVKILENQSSGVISSLARGNCYAVLNAGDKLINKGKTIQVILFENIFC